MIVDVGIGQLPVDARSAFQEEDEEEGAIGEEHLALPSARLVDLSSGASQPCRCGSGTAGTLRQP
jgi:hypothetical protein